MFIQALKKRVKSRSYGKLILAGEHAVVYGKPAIIFPINKFCEVKIINVGEGLRPSPWDGSKDPPLLRIINKEKDPHGIVNHVINSFFKEFNISPKGKLQIEINSTIPPGKGFGSSAAVITALVKSLYIFFVGVDLPARQRFAVGDAGRPVDPQLLLNFCISCENLIHKKSSGADIYASWFDKPIYFQNQNGKIKFQLLNCRGTPWRAHYYYLIDTGRPLESTGEMVQIVKACPRESGDQGFLDKNIKKIGQQTELIYKKNFTTSPLSKQLTDVSIHENIEKIENCLENLGVVSKEVMRFIKDLKQQKISAKICGAGGKTKGSGVVIAFTNNSNLLKKICGAYNYDILDIKLKNL